VREMFANAEPWNAADALLYKSFASPRPPAIEVGPQHRRFCICVDKKLSCSAGRSSSDRVISAR